MYNFAKFPSDKPHNNCFTIQNFATVPTYYK